MGTKISDVVTYNYACLGAAFAESCWVAEVQPSAILIGRRWWTVAGSCGSALLCGFRVNRDAAPEWLIEASTVSQLYECTVSM